MAIARNKNTTQTPMTDLGQTGAQSIKFIPAPRVYVKPADTLINAPIGNYITKSNGATPTITGGGDTWTDLGVVDGKATVTYTKKTTDVKTGIDNYLRDEYISEKTGQITFSLAQFDDVVIEKITGITPSIISAGSIVSYQLGQDDLTRLALLLVVQNKLDSKEWQFYNPAGIFNFTFDESQDNMVVKCTVTMPFFTAVGATSESLMSMTVFA